MKLPILLRFIYSELTQYSNQALSKKPQLTEVLLTEKEIKKRLKAETDIDDETIDKSLQELVNAGKLQRRNTASFSGKDKKNSKLIVSYKVLK